MGPASQTLVVTSGSLSLVVHKILCVLRLRETFSPKDRVSMFLVVGGYMLILWVWKSYYQIFGVADLSSFFNANYFLVLSMCLIYVVSL